VVRDRVASRLRERIADEVRERVAEAIRSALTEDASLVAPVGNGHRAQA
jgi:hypothetical protein